MKPNNILITEPDMERLRHLLDSGRSSARREAEPLVMLEQELDRASIVSPSAVPPDVITMNSRVRVTDLKTGEEMTYTLVFPRDANFDQGKISVLAPIGTAILGYRVGDGIEWRVPGGLRQFRVKEILYQPEAAERAARASEDSRNAEMGVCSRFAGRPRPRRAHWLA
ncbi:MAG TPA: nucleoside diphosphate kinase regulator [Candidatus Sulfotelmatobacter sp.]|nr:nucleoside diphosphate kinase regulator [Candidatus Sulfotelmatobacter sp.]